MPISHHRKPPETPKPKNKLAKLKSQYRYKKGQPLKKDTKAQKNITKRKKLKQQRSKI